jgi:hypothetical protein
MVFNTLCVTWIGDDDANSEIQINIYVKTAGDQVIQLKVINVQQ